MCLGHNIDYMHLFHLYITYLLKKKQILFLREKLKNMIVIIRKEHESAGTHISKSALSVRCILSMSYVFRHCSNAKICRSD